MPTQRKWRRRWSRPVCAHGWMSRSQRIGAKIREAQLQKIPYMLVVGDREAAAQQVAVRQRSGQDRGTVAVPEVIAAMQREVAEKAGEPLL